MGGAMGRAHQCRPPPNHNIHPADRRIAPRARARTRSMLPAPDSTNTTRGPRHRRGAQGRGRVTEGVSSSTARPNSESEGWQPEGGRR